MQNEKGVSPGRLFDSEKQQLLDSLEGNKALQRCGVKPGDLELITLSPFSLSILASEIGRGADPEFIFFPQGVKSERGGFIIGQESFLSNRKYPGAIKGSSFSSAYHRIKPYSEIVIAFPKGTRVSRIISESFGESIVATETKVSENVDKISSTIELYDPRMAGQVEEQGMTESVLSLEDTLEGIPQGIINPEDVGVGELLDPITYLTKILQEDRMPVQNVAERFARAWRKLQGSSHLRIGKKDYHQSTLTMINIVLGMHRFDEETPEGQKIFGLDDYVRSGFAGLTLEAGLWINPESKYDSEFILKHPVRGAALYKLLAKKNGDFTGIVAPAYEQMILRHHAGLGTSSRYPRETSLVDKELLLIPQKLSPLDESSPLAVQTQLAFIYSTLYPRLRHWLVSEDLQRENEDSAKALGWRSSEQMTLFLTLNWLKESMTRNYLTPEILDQEARAIGTYPQGSHVVLNQRDAENRERSKYPYHGYMGEILSSGKIELKYDSRGRAVYGKDPLDLRKGLGEQFLLDLKRI